MASTIDLGVIIPSERVRKSVYAVFAVLGVALSATQVAFSAAEAAQPVWLTVSLAVYGFLGAAGFGLATANTTPVYEEDVVGIDTGFLTDEDGFR